MSWRTSTHLMDRPLRIRRPDRVAHQVGHGGGEPHPEHGEHRGGTTEVLGAQRDQRRHHEHVAVHVGRGAARDLLGGRARDAGEMAPADGGTVLSRREP